MELQTCRAAGSFRSTMIPPRAALFSHATPRLPSPSNPYDRMLGYPTVFIDRIFRVNRYPHARVHAALRLFLLLAALLLAFAGATPPMAAPQTGFPSAKGGVANLEAKRRAAKETSLRPTATWTFITGTPAFAPTTSNTTAKPTRPLPPVACSSITATSTSKPTKRITMSALDTACFTTFAAPLRLSGGRIPHS